MNLILHPFLACRRCYWNGAYKVMSTTVSNRPSHYDLLGVQENASAEEIKQAFFGQCKKLHPDSDPANPNLHTRFVKLNEAYGVLSRESSRKEYDLSLQLHRQGFTGATRTDPFGYTSPVSRKSSASSTPTEDERYWQQFHQPPSESTERRHQRNKMLVGYCVLIMLGSLLAHYVGFRTIKEVHNNFLEEQNRIFSKIYNDSKERARAFTTAETNFAKRANSFVSRVPLKQSTSASLIVVTPLFRKNQWTEEAAGDSGSETRSVCREVSDEISQRAHTKIRPA